MNGQCFARKKELRDHSYGHAPNQHRDKQNNDQIEKSSWNHIHQLSHANAYWNQHQSQITQHEISRRTKICVHLTTHGKHAQDQSKAND